jgi:tRNA dimethylallyltransferase
MPRTLLVIVGPTGSGKTQLAELIAGSMDCSLLSADSQQVYRGLDIGTAKPLGEAKQAWGLLDLVDPGQPFSAGDWVRRAAPLADLAWSQGRLPIVVGGTGLYLKALLDGLADIPPVPDELRRALTRDLAAQGLAAMVARLQAVDPVLAARTDLANPRRVMRGLEVQAATGRPLSQWQAQPTLPALRPDKAVWLGVDPGKDRLDRALEQRTRAAMDQGWPQEVAGLAARHGDAALATSAAIGYPEVLDQLRGRQSADQAERAIVMQTRQYARRQRTWFKALAGVTWFSGPMDPKVQAFLASRL